MCRVLESVLSSNHYTSYFNPKWRQQCKIPWRSTRSGATCRWKTMALGEPRNPRPIRGWWRREGARVSFVAGPRDVGKDGVTGEGAGVGVARVQVQQFFKKFFFLPSRLSWSF